LEDLIGKRIDVLCSVEMNDSTKALKWCQGEVLSIVNENTVEVKWDPAPDIEGYKEQREYGRATSFTARQVE
jgi:hypothetical protein